APGILLLPIYNGLQRGTARCSPLFFVPVCRQNSRIFAAKAMSLADNFQQKQRGPMRFSGGGGSAERYDALATPRLSKSTLRFNAMTKPSTPSRRSTELNSERCTATWLIVPSR